MFVLAAGGEVYTGGWGELDGVIRCQLGEVVPYELGEELEPRREAPVFDTPTRGTSVEKFREMVFNHLKVRELFITRRMLLNTSDSNHSYTIILGIFPR